MKKKSFETVLYSAAGVALMLVIIVAFNFIAGTMKKRVDLTKEKAYTLSDGTRAILSKLDTPVKIRFYFSESETSAPETVMLKTYAERVDDLLSEYKQASKGKVSVEKLNPQPDSDAEDSARLDGVEGQFLSNGERLYFGLSVSQLDSKQTVRLSPDRERLLEYDLSRAISSVTTPEKPVIGVMTPLPVMGAPSNPMMARMGQQGQEPWVFINELKNDFTVRSVEMTTDKIPDDVKVLVVMHPKDISDTAQYAIDQFVLRGGKLIAFLDGLSLVDSRQQNPMMGGMPGGGSSLEKLLKAWGLQFDTSKVVADIRYKMQLMGPNRQPVDAPAFLSLPEPAINSDDIVTAQLDNVWMPMGGAFTGTPAAGLKQTVLLKSSPDSQLVDGMMASMSGEEILKEFKPSGTEYALGVRLTGKFKTAFPDGKPATPKPEGEEKEGEKPEQKKADNSLKESAVENVVLLFGDSDLLYDQFALQQSPFGFMPMNSNIALGQGAVEQMTGDSNLISVRSRATQNRPFTRIRDMQAEASEKYRSKIQELEKSLTETRQRLSELQQNKDTGQRFILSPEQAAEVEKFEKTEAQANRDLKEVRKSLQKDINSLENRLKWMNIAVMPLLVAFSGITLAFYKRKRTSAK